MQIGFHLNVTTLTYELVGKWTLDHCSVCLCNCGRKFWCFLVMGKIKIAMICFHKHVWRTVLVGPTVCFCLLSPASCLCPAFVTLPWGQKVPVGGLRAWASLSAVLIRTREGWRKGPSVLSLCSIAWGVTPRFCSAGAQAVGAHYVSILALVQMPNKYSLFPLVQLKYHDFFKWNLF